jgi:nicotinate-nucleotide adenylyltransferase
VATLVEVPAMAILSTDCRRRVAEGRPVWYLVPDGLVQYISKRNPLPGREVLTGSRTRR